MVQFNFSERTIKAKVVYYGPAQSGKTTNLEQIHLCTDPTSQNRLISLNTAQDRTLFFDLLPFSLGSVSGYDFKIQLYTVPGQVQYNATRRVVLAGADAVVFVADARRSAIKDNVSAFENMKVNLLANRLVPEKIPLVLQYNKQDLPDLLSMSELNKALNPWQRPCFPAVGVKGEGVMETFVSIVEQTLTAIAIKYGLKEKGLDPALVPQLVKAAFEIRLKEAAAPAPSVGGSTAPRAATG
jgi:signal recognition particle receptor subunit beta